MLKLLSYILYQTFIKKQGGYKKIMKKIGYAEDIEDYEEQIDYLDSILSTLEDLQILYGKDPHFSDLYKDSQRTMDLLDEEKQDLENEKSELEERESKEYDEELKAMNAEFERSRL